MKTLLSMLLAGVAVPTCMAATILDFSNNTITGVTDKIGLIGTSNSTHNLADETVLSVSVTGGKLWENSITSTWSNQSVADEMNQTLGTSIDLTSVSSCVATGAGSSTSSLTFNFTGNGSVNVGDSMVFYFLVSSGANGGGSYTNFSCSGLDNISIQWAAYNGDGYQNSATGTGIAEASLIKVTGEVSTENSVVFSSTVAKNGWAMGAYAVVPEPATATLSLLGLAALMVRRRRA